MRRGNAPIAVSAVFEPAGTKRRPWGNRAARWNRRWRSGEPSARIEPMPVPDSRAVLAGSGQSLGCVRVPFAVMARLDRAIGTGAGGSVREAIAARNIRCLRSRGGTAPDGPVEPCHDGQMHSGIVQAIALVRGCLPLRRYSQCVNFSDALARRDRCPVPIG